VVASLVRNVVSTALVLGVAFLIGLLLGTPAGASPWHALAWRGGILLASVAVSGDAFRHRMTGCCDERNSGVPFHLRSRLHRRRARTDRRTLRHPPRTRMSW